MNRDDAKIWLAKNVAASSEPPIGSEDLERLLDEAAGAGATSFTMRQLNQAAAAGWGERVSATAEYHGKEREIHEHAVERQRFYSRRASGGGALATTVEPDSVKALL